MATKPISQPVEYIDPYLAEWQKLLPLADMAGWGERAPPPKSWTIADWLPSRQASYLTGAGSSGKSLLGQMMATCIAAGRPFFGVATTASPALYVSCEDDEDELHRRQIAICSAMNIPLADIEGSLKLSSLVGSLNTALSRQAIIEANEFQPVAEKETRPSKLFEAIRGIAIDAQIGFVVLDNVAHFYTGNENDRHEVASFMSLLNLLARVISGTVLLIGHPNKGGASFSGSTAWENQVRSRLYLETPKDENGECIDSDARVLRLEKANYARNGSEIRFRWHAGAFVPEGHAPFDLRAASAQTLKATSDNAIFLECLRQRNGQQRAVSDAVGPNYAPAQFEQMPAAKHAGVKRGRLKEAMERLFAIEAIEHAFLWRDTAKGRDVSGLREVTPKPTPNGPQT